MRTCSPQGTFRSHLGQNHPPPRVDSTQVKKRGGEGDSMAESTMEIDFFQIEKQKASPKPSTTEHVGLSCRRIQNVVSKINPLVLKTVMAAGATAHGRSADGNYSRATWNPSQSSSNPSSPSAAMLLSPLPVLSPESRSALQGHLEATPLTIFYNGVVTAFDVPRDKAEAIIRMAASGLVEGSVERPEYPSLDDHLAEGDLPIPRRKSLQRFLEKRKERYIRTEPNLSPPCPLFHHQYWLAAYPSNMLLQNGQ